MLYLPFINVVLEVTLIIAYLIVSRRFAGTSPIRFIVVTFLIAGFAATSFISSLTNLVIGRTFWAATTSAIGCVWIFFFVRRSLRMLGPLRDGAE